MSEAARKQRDELELKLERLRSKKPAMEEDAYYAALEPILVELAKVYKAIQSESLSENKN